MATGKNKTNDEDRIRQQIENFVQAFRTRDLNLMMSLYGPRFVSFDIVPPLQCVGKEAYRKVWEEAFSLFQDPIEIEIRDLIISCSEDLAFSHHLSHLRATRVNGQKADYWERLTFCFRRMDGEWLMVHEHVSVPVDFKNGKAVLDLTP
jgi:ketosteroid isomerase-like protein